MVPVPKEPISQVVFVEDHVQLVFQEERFSFYEVLEVVSERGVLRRGESGFCDALVGLIGEQASSVTLDDADELTLVFGNGSALRARWGSGTGPEVWHFNGPDGQIIVGRAS